MTNQNSNTTKSGFIEDDDDDFDVCTHPEHNPPMHLYIPPGKKYRHVCPGCGLAIIIRGTGVMM